MPARVVRVLDNGLLLLEGRRAVVVNDETQVLAFSGTVRPEDITPENTVRSTQVADAEVTIVGKGLLVREVDSGDIDAITQLYGRLSSDDRYRRFFSHFGVRPHWVAGWVERCRTDGLGLVAVGPHGVVVGEGSDIGGGASTMGTLSGGGKEIIALGKRCLLGANSGCGIPLGDDCVIEAGLYITAGTKVVGPDGTEVKARDLAGASNILFRRNSTTGVVEVVPWKGDGIALTYSVLLHGVVQGCIYVRPALEALHTRGLEGASSLQLVAADVVVRGWLHDRAPADLIAASMSWLGAAPFTFPRLWWQTSSACPDQLAACDELGLTERDSDGFRLRPDGESLLITVEYAPVFGPWRDVLQMISEQSKAIGIRMVPQAEDRALLAERAGAGDARERLENRFMKITLNGEEREVATGTTVHKLILDAGRKPAATVVERNGDIVDREAYTSVRLDEGDTVELVQFVGGG